MLSLQLSSQTNHIFIIWEKQITFLQFRPSYDHFDHNWAWNEKNKLNFLKLQKNGWSQSFAVKRTYLTHYISYSNLKGKGSSCKISWLIGNSNQRLKWAWKAWKSTTLELWKIGHLLEMFKWYYYHFLKFLIGTDLPKMSRSDTSR